MSKCLKRESSVPMVLCVELPNGMLSRVESAALRLIPADRLPEDFERYGNGVLRFQDLPSDARAASFPAGFVVFAIDKIRAFHAESREADNVSARIAGATFDEAYALGVAEAAKGGAK